MRMGAVEKKKGVLKLVHPGGFVEMHKKPVFAYQVMRKNPRHCVTRPDVFKYPWIVVRPESLLKLGTVFFIVPNHTIYHLMQEHMSRLDALHSSPLMLPPPPPGHYARSLTYTRRPVEIERDGGVLVDGDGEGFATASNEQDDGWLESKWNIHMATPKSCLRNRKDGNLKRGHVKRVTFVLPDGADDADGGYEFFDSCS